MCISNVRNRNGKFRWALLLEACLCALFLGFPLYPSTATAQEAPVIRFTVTEFKVTGDNPLATEEAQQALRKFLGDHVGLDGLLAAADTLEKSLSDKGFSFHRVNLPPQALKSGVIRLEIIEFRIGKVLLKGNELFSDKNILASVPVLKEGGAPNTRRLSRAMALANEHPAKDIRIVLKESEEAAAIDAHLEVKEKDPRRFFLAANNTGTRETGRARISLGFQHSNLFDRDHVLTLSYTTSPENPDRVKQYGLNYHIPLYEYAGSLRLFASKSSVDSGTLEQVTDVAGKGTVLGARYTHNFLKLGKYRHKVILGLDDKYFDNDVTSGGAVLLDDVRSRPLSIQYEGEYPWQRGKLGFYAAHIRNLGGGKDNTDNAYALQPRDPGQEWDVFRAGLNGDVYLQNSGKNGWLLRGLFQGQLSNESLISGEQFGVGGSRSVRGFEERAIYGDSGYLISAELWGPLLQNNLRLLGFADGGYSKYEEPLASDRESNFLASVGAGVRWSWQRKLGVQADLALVLDDAPARMRMWATIGRT